MSFALALSLLAATPQAPADAIAIAPLGDAAARDVGARAVFDAVDGALPALAAEHGLVAKRFALVKPVHEAARACTTHDCVRAQVQRLGARYAVTVALRDGALALTLVDAASPARHEALAQGTRFEVLTRAPRALDELLERVAPRVEHQRATLMAELRAARLADRHEEAARVCFQLAALLPAEMASWTFDGADSLADAGRVDEARAIFAQLAADASLDEDVRVEALARTRVTEDE